MFVQCHLVVNPGFPMRVCKLLVVRGGGANLLLIGLQDRNPAHTVPKFDPSRSSDTNSRYFAKVGRHPPEGGPPFRRQTLQKADPLAHFTHW